MMFGYPRTSIMLRDRRGQQTCVNAAARPAGRGISHVWS